MISRGRPILLNPLARLNALAQAIPLCLQCLDNRFARYLLMTAYRSKDGHQRAQPKRIVIWNRYSLVAWLWRLKDDVAANLMYFRISPSAAQYGGKMSPGNIARYFHATDNTSSRTKCSRTRSGVARSKKKAVTASRTFARSSSQVLPCVKMFSVRHSAQYPPSDSCTTSKTNSVICSSYGARRRHSATRPTNRTVPNASGE
jgi:hypothetical protein